MVAAFKPRFVDGSLLDLGGDGFKKNIHTQMSSFSTALTFQAFDVICVTERGIIGEGVW